MPAVWIEKEALKKLCLWKALFSDEVSRIARRLAAESAQPTIVTAAHYRQAAREALQVVATALDDDGQRSTQRRAA